MQLKLTLQEYSIAIKDRLYRLLVPNENHYLDLSLGGTSFKGGGHKDLRVYFPPAASPSSNKKNLSKIEIIKSSIDAPHVLLKIYQVYPYILYNLLFLKYIRYAII